MSESKSGPGLVGSPFEDAVPAELRQRWENAYRKYVAAIEELQRYTPEAGKPFIGAAGSVAGAAGLVAWAWRDVAVGAVLPSWVAVAVEAAATAFEAQGHEFLEQGLRVERALDRGGEPWSHE